MRIRGRGSHLSPVRRRHGRHYGQADPIPAFCRIPGRISPIKAIEHMLQGLLINLVYGVCDRQFHIFSPLCQRQTDISPAGRILEGIIQENTDHFRYGLLITAAAEHGRDLRGQILFLHLGPLPIGADDIRGKVCGIKIVDEEDDIILVSSDGIIIRILASDIRIMGRIAKGVRVMRVNEGANVVAFTRAEHDDNAETEKVEQLTEEQLKEAEAEAALEEQNEVVVDEEPDDDDNEE